MLAMTGDLSMLLSDFQPFSTVDAAAAVAVQELANFCMSTLSGQQS